MYKLTDPIQAKPRFSIDDPSPAEMNLKINAVCQTIKTLGKWKGNPLAVKIREQSERWNPVTRQKFCLDWNEGVHPNLLSYRYSLSVNRVHRLRKKLELAPREFDSNGRAR